MGKVQMMLGSRVQSLSERACRPHTADRIGCYFFHFRELEPSWPSSTHCNPKEYIQSAQHSNAWRSRPRKSDSVILSQTRMEPWESAILKSQPPPVPPLVALAPARPPCWLPFPPTARPPALPGPRSWYSLGSLWLWAWAGRGHVSLSPGGRVSLCRLSAAPSQGWTSMPWETRRVYVEVTDPAG